MNEDVYCNECKIFLTDRELNIVNEIGDNITSNDLCQTTLFVDLDISNIYGSAHFTLMIEYEDKLTGEINTSVARFCCI